LEGRAAGLGFWADEGAGWSGKAVGRFEGVAFAGGAAGGSGAEVNDAAGTDGDWSSAKIATPLGIGAWSGLPPGIGVA